MNASPGVRQGSSIDYLIRKGSVITAITLVSRPLGYLREAIQAYLFGATLLVDAFVISFNFPEMIQTLFFSGATSAFLIPVCSRYVADKEDFSRIYATFVNLSIIIMGIVSLIFLLFSGPLTAIIAPGFGSEGREAVRILFVMMIPVIVLHAVLSVMKGFLNAREHFAAPEMSGILWNIIFILFALALSGKIGIYSLAAGVSTGSLVQVLLQIPFLRRHGIRYSFTLALGHPSVREARNLFAGALIATSIVPINSFVGRVIASYLPQGEVASLAYASRIFILPFSLFAVPTYTVLFSRISTLYHAKDRQGIRGHIDSSLILLCVTLVPATIFLCLAGDIFVKILYERGAFSAKDTAMTYRALFGYSVGLLFYALSISFVRIFNAFHDMKTPAIVGVTSILLNALLAYLLMHSLGNLGISLATSIVSFYNFMLLYFILKTKIGYRMARETRREIIRSLLAGIITALLIFSIRSLLGSASVLSFVLSLVAACSVYGILFKSYYLHYIGRKMGRRPGNSKE